MSFLFRYLRFHDIIGGIHVPVDDGVDKLNRKYTLLVFLFLALPIFTKQYIGDPIECFAPVYFAEHQSRYINSYCWTQSTYYMVPVGDPEDDGDQLEPPDRVMPDEVDYFIGFETVTHIGNERLRRVRVSYYQWAPLILLVQGLCFYIPFLIWNSCAHNAGVKLRRLLKKASDIASLPPGCQQREALLAEFVDQFHTLVTGEAGWCVDVPCVSSSTTGASTNNQQAAITDNNYQTSSTTTSSTLSNTNNNNNTQTLARGANHALARNSAHHQHHHHHHTHSNNQASQQNNQANNNQDDASSTSGTAAINQQHQQHQQQQQVGCCLSGVPIIGSLLCCWLRPCCAPFNLIGPSKYLCLLYLAVKSFYVFNVGLQFFLLGTFLGRGYLRHGLELINRLIVSGDWWASPRFPLSTLCQVRADMSGGLRSYTCQCVLPINVFNEKIFSVVWFYMAFLMPLNVLSLLYWIYRTLPTNRLAYIRLCLWRTRLVELNQIHRTVRRLSQSYLGWDGVFLLRLIEHNHGSIMATLIMSRLWEFYANQMKLQEDANALQLANNAHNTLSQTTTAYNSQQQQIIAAAAAAAQQQHQHQQHHHGHNNQQHAHHHHNHNSSSQQQQQQQQPHHGSHHHHQHPHHHSSNHNSQHQLMTQHHHSNTHHHPPPPPPPANALAAHFAANNQSVVNTQNAAPFNSSSANHHSGQVSQAGSGHHGLHAANAHHALNSVQLPANFATSQASANLLAHLQQAGANNTLLAAVAAQNQATAGNQGNVSAVLACLAPKAAVQTNTSGQQVPGAHHAQQSAAIASQQQLSNTQQQQQQQQQSLASSTAQAAAASAAAAAAVASALASGANTNSQSAQHHHHHSQQQQQNPTSTTSFITNNPAAAAAAVAAAAAAAAAASSVPAANEGLVPQASGPPLPPPPPAHVVAAAAAAAANSAGITATSSVPVNARSRNATNNQQHATTVSANNNQQSLSNNSDHNQQQQQLNQTQGGQASAASVFGANLKSSNQTPAQKTKR